MSIPNPNQTCYDKYSKALSLLIFFSCSLLVLAFTNDVKAITSDQSKSNTNEKQQKTAVKRIITAGGSITEIAYALGAQDYLIATDTSSVYPSDTQTLPKVGYYRQLSTEGVLSLSPTHLIAASGVGPENVLSQLSSTGLDIRVINHDRSVQGLIDVIKLLGNELNKTNEAEKLIGQVTSQISDIQSSYDFNNKRIVFLMSAGERGLVAAGNNTVPNMITNILSATNPFSQLNGFKPISVEALILANPDLILMPEHTIRETSITELCSLPSLKFWANQSGCNLHSVESLPFLGLTPRLPEALKHTADLLNGDQYANKR